MRRVEFMKSLLLAPLTFVLPKVEEGSKPKPGWGRITVKSGSIVENCEIEKCTIYVPPDVRKKSYSMKGNRLYCPAAVVIEEK